MPRDDRDAAPALMVAHDIRGRLRLRVPAGARTEGLAEAIAQRAGVAACIFTPRTRSLLVRYDPDTVGTADLVREVAAHADVDEPPAPRAEPAVPHPPSVVSTAIAEGVSRLDRRLHAATQGTLDLGTVMPLALGFWAVREMLRGQVAPLAWSSALWYAHGLFRDYNIAGPELAAAAGAAAPSEP
jgi:heavy-metal-associated domain-containing protein